jgi:hypothetical protein
MIARVGKKNRDKKGSGFKYKKRSVDEVKKRADQTGGNYDSPVLRGFDMWRPQGGENIIRILPPTWDDFEHYGFDVYEHRFIGSDSSNYICLNKMKGKHCPACDEAKALKDDGEEDDAKKMSFQKRCWVWIVDRSDKSLTPQIWDMSWSQDRDLAAMTTLRGGKVLYIDHPDDGYDVIVKKKGAGMKTSYTITIDRDSSPISDDDDKQEEILNFIQENPVPTVLQFFSAEHIEKKLAGTTAPKDDDLDDDEDEDKPRKKKAGKRSRDEEDDEDEAPKKKKKRPDPDEDEDDEEETPRRRRKSSEDDDDEEEEKPKKKRRPADDDDDEEEEKPKKKKRRPDPDEDEDEEEEDERPKKKKKKPVEEDDEDEEDERPKKKKRKVEEDEDDEEDERPAKKKKRKVVEEDDEDDD